MEFGEVGLNVTSLSQTASAGADMLLIFLGFLSVLLMVLWFAHWTSFKVEFRIKELVNGRKLLRKTKAKIKKYKDGLAVVQLRGPFPWGLVELPAPPEEAIEIDYKGFRHIEAYRTATNEYIYLKDTSKLPEVPKELLDMDDGYEKTFRIKEWKTKNNVVNSYQPITANQRMFFIGQIRKAHDKKKTGVMEILRDALPFMAFIIFVVMIMVFWGKFMAPANDMMAKANELMQKNIEFEEHKIELEQLKNDIQVIKQEVIRGNQNNTQPPQ